MSIIRDTLNDLEAKAKSATPDLNTAVGGGIGFVLFKGGHKFWSNSTSDDQASSDKQYIAACSPDTVLALITALREAEETLIKCDKIFKVVEDVGRESFCYADFRPEHIASKTWLAKYAKGD